MTWRFLNTGFSDGMFNMEFDEGLARELQDRGAGGTVRVYGWSPPAISIGWNQSLDDIDTIKARSSGIEIVRRPTGGRAILHSEELTYSVVVVAEGRNVLQVYSDVSRALVEGIRLLGVDAVLEKSQPHFPTLYRERSSVACFSSSGRYEIKVNGKKLVGSAQRRMVGRNDTEVVLQHGSLLLGPDHLRIADFLTRGGEGVRRELEQSTTNLGSILGSEIVFEDAARALRQGFERTWGVTFSSPVSQEQEKVTV